MADELWPGVRRVIAGNPSPMTERGTNSWIIGSGAVAVIDPGPDLPGHLVALLAAIGGARVEAIFVTHSHQDHSGLAPALSRATGAPVLGFGPSGTGRSAAMAALEAQGLTDGGEGIDRAFRPDVVLEDGAVWRGAVGEVRALHTPGHMGNHLCLMWEGVGFSGDHVMGWASSLVSPPEGDLGDYMKSLDRLAAVDPVWLMPGHGAVVDDPAARIAALAAHRRAREGEILAALGAGTEDVASIVAVVYRNAPPALHPAAGRNVLAHLVDLHGRKVVEAAPQPGPGAAWRIV
jgi:hydroxyacylglutathione hydrolase